MKNTIEFKNAIDPGDAMILGFLSQSRLKDKELLKSLTEGRPRELGRAIIIVRDKKKRTKDIPNEYYESAENFLAAVEENRKWHKREDNRRKARKELEAAAQKIAKKYGIEIRLRVLRIDGIDWSDGVTRYE